MLPSVGIFNSLPSGGRDVFDSTITPPFLDISCSYEELSFCACRHLYRLIKTEICITIVLIVFYIDKNMNSDR